MSQVRAIQARRRLHRKTKPLQGRCAIGIREVNILERDRALGTAQLRRPFYIINRRRRIEYVINTVSRRRALLRHRIECPKCAQFRRGDSDRANNPNKVAK